MLDSSLHVPVEHSKTDIRCITLPSLWNQPLLRNTKKAGENTNVCVPPFVHRQLFGSTPLSTVRKTNAVGCTLSLEPLQPFMQGKASRNILILCLISLLDSFCFPSEQFIHCVVCKPVNSPPSSPRLGKPRCLRSEKEHTNHQPSTIKIRDSADSNGPRTKFALPAADPSHLSSQVPRADSRCRSSARCPLPA